MHDSTGSGRRASGGFDPARLRQKCRQERDNGLRPDGSTAMGGQYGSGPLGYPAVVREWAATGVDRDLAITKASL